eukprot:TRINITY_DN363_c0_g1_i1.p1 TRINITY_DN363_c0_g1~~TRINITY_DN363_c0_g1_i1.p1  ORF type:complete len:314 (+),score=42.20 TRINITY_DN363_c0_g1_i1:37-978(+)
MLKRIAKMNNATVVSEIRKFVPVLCKELHKGSSGKIGVIGGCLEYTGAPYFSAISGLKTGCDIAHIFCAKDAGFPIKSYSPDLIVHPIIPPGDDFADGEVKLALHKVENWLPGLSGIVIGPGMGRSEPMIQTAKAILESAIKQDLSIVIDGDGLSTVVCKWPDLIKGYRKAILTPNFNEYKRLCASVQCPEDASVEELSKKFGNVTIVQKGQKDTISNGETTLECTETGSYRRCGGQGDLTSGAICVFSCWAHKYEGKDLQLPQPVLAGYAGCLLTRSCAANTFKIHGRAMTTQDMVTTLGASFASVFETSKL